MWSTYAIFPGCMAMTFWIPIKISLKFIRKGPIHKILALVQIMAPHRPGYKPLSEPIMVSLPMHIYVSFCLNELKENLVYLYIENEYMLPYKMVWELRAKHVTNYVTFLRSST